MGLTLGILLVDDNEPYRAGVRAILESTREIEVGGVARPLRWLDAPTAELGLRMVRSQQPDIVLVDLRLPNVMGVPSAKVGLDFTRQVIRESPGTKVVVLTVCKEDDLVGEALRAGAKSYLVKDADDHRGDLLRTLQAVANDEVLLGRQASESLSKILSRKPSSTLPPPFDRLHPERDKKYCAIVKLIGEGLEYKEIAKKLDVPEATVNNHISEIVKRLELPSRNVLYFHAGRVLGS